MACHLEVLLQKIHWSQLHHLSTQSIRQAQHTLPIHWHFIDLLYWSMLRGRNQNLSSYLEHGSINEVDQCRFFHMKCAILPQSYVMIARLPRVNVCKYLGYELVYSEWLCMVYATMVGLLCALKLTKTRKQQACTYPFNSLLTITYNCANVVKWHTPFRKIKL